MCVGDESFRLIVHVGGTNQPDAQQLAEDANDYARSEGGGVCAIAVCAPSFIRPSSAGELIRYCRHIAEKAPALPFYFYHIPSLSNVVVDMPVFLQQAKKEIPTFAGIKFTHNDLAELSVCTELFGPDECEILFGRDELLISGLSFGAHGAIGGTYNFLAPRFREVIEQWEQGHGLVAAEKQRQITSFLHKCLALPADPLAVLRSVTYYVSNICLGSARPPTQVLDKEMRGRVSDLVEQHPELFDG